MSNQDRALDLIIQRSVRTNMQCIPVSLAILDLALFDAHAIDGIGQHRFEIGYVDIQSNVVNWAGRCHSR